MAESAPECCDACGSHRAVRIRDYPLPPPLSDGSPFVPVECYEVQCWACGRRGKHTRYVFADTAKST